MPDQGADGSDKRVKSDEKRAKAHEKATEKKRGFLRSAETLDKNAAARRERDFNAFSPVTEWKQIPKAMKDRFTRNVETSILSKFGVAGEALFQARRADVGQKWQAARNVLKLSAMSALGGRSVIGEYFANKISNSVDFSDDPHKQMQNFKITTEAISHELLTINNRFKVSDNAIKEIATKVTALEKTGGSTKLTERVDSLYKRVDKIQAQVNQTSSSVERTFNSMGDRFGRIEKRVSDFEDRLIHLEKMRSDEGDEESLGKGINERLKESRRERRKQRKQKDFEAADFNDKDTAERPKGIERGKNESKETTLFSGIPLSSLKGFMKRKVEDAIPPILPLMLRMAPFAAIAATAYAAYEGVKELNRRSIENTNKPHPRDEETLGWGDRARQNAEKGTNRVGRFAQPNLIEKKSDNPFAEFEELLKNPKKDGEAESFLEKLERERKPKGKVEPLFMFDQGRISDNIEDRRDFPIKQHKRSDIDFVSMYQAQKREEDKKNFMLFGKMPSGFEFMQGHMGRLGSAEAVAATGAMPLQGGGFNGTGTTGAWDGSGGGSYFPGQQGFGAPSPEGSGISVADMKPTDWQKPGGTNIGRSEVGTDVGPMSVDRRGYVKPEQYYQEALKKLEGSKLIGFVPKDGARFGIATGSKEEWARFMTQLTKQESSFNVNTVGDGGNSIGLSQMKAGEYGIKNPNDPHQAQSGMIKQFEKYVIASGHITGRGSGPGTYGGWKGAAAYFGPLRRENEYFQHNQWMSKLRSKLDSIDSGLPELSLFKPEKLGTETKNELKPLSLLPIDKPNDSINSQETVVPLEQSDRTSETESEVMSNPSTNISLSQKEKYKTQENFVKTDSGTLPEPISVTNPSVKSPELPENLSVSKSGIPEQFAFRKEQPLNTSLVKQNQQSQAKTRRLPISSRLEKTLAYAAEKSKVEVEIYSGGQGRIGSGKPRVGSTRHDDGNAADLKLYVRENGKRRLLDMRNQHDQNIMSEFVRHSRSAGATGIGAAEGYMGPSSLHVGFGDESVWGAGGSAMTAPRWLRQAFNDGRKNPADLSLYQPTGKITQAQQDQTVTSTNSQTILQSLPENKSNPNQKSFTKSIGMPIPNAAEKLQLQSGTDQTTSQLVSPVPDGAKVVSAESAGFSEADTKPVSGLDTVAGVSAPTTVDVPSVSPEKPAIATAAEATASIEQTDYTTARAAEQPEGGSRSSSESTDARVPQGGGRYNPESEAAKPGSSGYGSSGRCFV